MQNIPKIVSSGQTGADRAALDWALSHKLPCGGWCLRLARKGLKLDDLKLSAQTYFSVGSLNLTFLNHEIDLIRNGLVKIGSGSIKAQDAGNLNR
jgi:hypothetical protein